MFDWKSRSLLPRLLYIVQCRNRYRPHDNNIDWWKSYIAEFFSTNSVVRLSVKDMPAFQPPQSVIPSSLTNTEVPYEVLPRLFQFKYEKGVQEELLFLGNVIESPLPGGGTSIICYQAAESLVFEGFSLVQYGHLKVVFNSSLKVQLLDFNVTGYDLHLNHRVIQSEIRNLCHVLESRCQTVGHLVSNPTQTPDFRAAADALKYAVDYTRNFSEALERYLSFEWSYIQKVLHFMQVADVISSMHELFYHCNVRRVSPLDALQQYGKISLRQGGAGGDGLAQEHDMTGNNQANPGQHPEQNPSTSAGSGSAVVSLRSWLGPNQLGQNPLGPGLLNPTSLNPLGPSPLGLKDPQSQESCNSPSMKGPLASGGVPSGFPGNGMAPGQNLGPLGLQHLNSLGIPKGLPGPFFVPNPGANGLPSMAARFNPQLAMNLMSGPPGSPSQPPAP